MVLLTAHVWQKKSCVDTLHTNVYHISDGDHKIADIMNMVMGKIPSNSNAAFQESQSTSGAVKKAIPVVVVCF